MRAVLILVLLLVIGATVFFTVRQNTGKDAPEVDPGPVNVEQDKRTPWDEWLAAMDAAGAVQPAGSPAFEVNVDLEMVGAKPRLHFHVREVHGWAAAGIYVHFWHQSYDEDAKEWVADTPPVQYLCRKNLYFNEMLNDFTTPIPTEFPTLNGNWGTSESWKADVRIPPKLVRAPKK